MEYVEYKIIKRELKLNELSRQIRSCKEEIRDLKANLESGIDLWRKDTPIRTEALKYYVFLLKTLERLEEKYYDVLSGRVY